MLPLRLYQFSVSLKLSVVVFILLGVLTAIGTFVESRFDQETANQVIYHSVWMTGTLALLTLNLSAVLVDRWPWKQKHIPFILAHFGILIIIFGSALTRYFGLDGSIRFQEGEPAEGVLLPEREIALYSSFDGESFTQLYRERLDLSNPPSKDRPLKISAGKKAFLIHSHNPHGFLREDFKPDLKGGYPALRFYLEGTRGQFVEWLFLPPGKKTLIKNLGPARVIFTTDPQVEISGKNQLLIYGENKRLFYSLKKNARKALQPGQVFSTGWMDFKFRLVDFYPKAKRVFEFSPAERPSENTTPALYVSHKENRAWVALGSYIQFYEKDRMYALGYLHRKRPLDFSLRLLDFRVQTYQGTNKAKSYESDVEVFGKKHTVSMNQPLKIKGYTFYQSGFEKDDRGEPVISILSVNRDPGRFVKYAGSGLVVLGITVLFYRRKKLFGRKL